MLARVTRLTVLVAALRRPEVRAFVRAMGGAAARLDARPATPTVLDDGGTAGVLWGRLITAATMLHGLLDEAAGGPAVTERSAEVAVLAMRLAAQVGRQEG